MAYRDLRESPQLLFETLRHFAALLRSEAELAKSELREKAASAGTGLTCLAAAAILALAGLQVLATALVTWIASVGLTAELAALLVGGALLAGAAGLLAAAKGRLNGEALLPSRTIRSVQLDVASIKEATHDRN
ncbi:phage holin family protein [Leisingera sp. ANG59]|uniref:phage holin family protein n=1 Tax=Leisingera sp. ANG59 TaxID=2675221 RepID=UPI0015716800|nr:phage holin family protein [Leisingera sp. ANG59]NSY41098.1 phage holin family protein [Leisingera sp. ANG59]